MHSRFVWRDAQFLAAKNCDAISQCVRVMFAGDMVVFPVVVDGGDDGVVFGSGIGTYSAHERSPLHYWEKGVVPGCPLCDRIQLPTIFSVSRR